MTSPFAWLGVVGVVGSSAGPGPAAVTWSLGEKAKFPNGKPTAARIAEYFEPAVRDGKKLNMMAGNWCAAGVCFAASRVVGSVDLEKAGLPHAYRVSGKELEDDAIKHKAWLSAAEVGAGARPAVGDVAIYNRGDPNDWTRHVSRVVAVRADGYTSIDANGPGAAWAVVEKEWQATNLRGFIRYPASSPGVTSKQGLGAGLLMVGAAGALLWATLKVGGKLRRNPESLEGFEWLSYHLGPPGSIKQIGAERGQPVRDGIARYVSTHGSYRYVLYEAGRAVASLQVVSRDGKHAQVAVVYVAPDRRRQKLASKLFRRVQQDFQTVGHADEDDHSPAGYAWSRQIKSNPRRSLLPPVGTQVRVLPLPGQARWNKANAGWESPVEGHDSRGFVEIRDRRGRLMRLRPWEIELVQ